MKNLIVYLCDLLFPPRCIYCDELLKPEYRPMICGKCMDKVPLKNAVCSKCGGSMAYADKYPVCPTCKAAGRYYDFVYAPTLYEDESKRAIINFKYTYRTENAEPLTYFLVKGLRQAGISNRIIDFAVSVPADSDREKIRGFDSSGMIAKYTARKLGIEYKKDILKKYVKNEKQSGLNKTEREENVKGVYTVTGDVKGKRILLIDDIFTTGATAAEISKILKRAGAKYVFAATVAKTKTFSVAGDNDET